MKYHVFALGNALVDLEYAISDEFLDHQGISKGVMTLVDANAQENTINAIPSHPVKRSCGGSAANTIIALQHFGGQGYYACKVADDEMGHFFTDDLISTGVSTNLKPEALDKTDVTGKCLVMITPDAERTMHTYLGISEHVSTKEVDAAAIEASEYIYLEGYLVASESARAAAIETHKIAKAKGTKVALTFSDPNMVKFFRNELAQMAEGGVDLLFCNEQEALIWSETKTIEQAIPVLKQLAGQFVVTLGGEGALLYDGQEITKIPARKVTPIDTNGAGDMFAGAFLYALTAGASFIRAGQLAIDASARLIMHYGPRLEHTAHLEVLDQWVDQEKAS